VIEHRKLEDRDHVEFDELDEADLAVGGAGCFRGDPDPPGDGLHPLKRARRQGGECGGLGEAVVRGIVQPDRIVVGRAGRRVEGAGGALNESQALELAGLGLKVEAMVGAPVDVEWGWAEGRFAMLQCRPIRGLELARAAARIREAEVARMRARGATMAVSNLAETLPAPTPLTWDLIGRRLLTRGIVRMYRDLGFAPTARVGREGFLELVAGRPYADLERSAELIGSHVPIQFGARGDRPFDAMRAARARETRELISWSATTSLPEGLRQTVAWYRNTWSSPTQD